MADFRGAFVSRWRDFSPCPNASMCVCPTTRGQSAFCGWCWKNGKWNSQRSSSLSTEEFRTLSCTRASSRWWARVSSMLRSPPGPGSSPEGSTPVCVPLASCYCARWGGMCNWEENTFGSILKNIDRPVNVGTFPVCIEASPVMLLNGYRS